MAERQVVEFYRVDTLSDEHKQKLEDFKKRIADKDHGKDVTDGRVLRFLVSRQFDFDLTDEKMENDYKWRKKETPEKWIPILTEEMKSMDNSRLGVVLPKKDREGRPVILIQANRMNKNWDWEIKVQCTYKMVEMLCSQIPEDGNFGLLWDMDSLGWANVDYEIAKFAIDLLQNYYPERMAYSFVFNVNWIFRIAYGIVSPWLDPRTRQKIHIMGDDIRTEFIEILMDAKDLPTKLKGDLDCGNIFDDLNAPPEPAKGWLW